MRKPSKTLKLVTMGDSLTQGGVPPEYRIENPNLYQSFLHRYLKKEGIDVDIWNLGIGGQTIGQIVSRLAGGLPADIVSILGGTNDVWHFFAAMKDHEHEIVEGIIEELTRGIEIVKAHPACKDTIVIICSLPPVGNVKTVLPGMIDTVNQANVEIEALCAQKGVIFCDVNKAMRAEDEKKYAKPQLVVLDGVHFTPEGNKACGEAIARTICHVILK
nr:SGNH/GDSL hydrolase family protein [Candidatus Sigynarchaeota archaeon]